MNYLIVSATAFEIAPFLNRYRKGDFASLDIDVLVSGVGITASMYNLGRQVALKRPDLIIQAGIAGCFEPAVPLSTVFLVEKDLTADEGVWEKNKWHSTMDMGFSLPNRHPYKKGWLTNPYIKTMKRPGLGKVRGITVNQISSAKKTVEEYRRKYQPTLESMEGSALHYLALSEHIPFIQLRAVSNYAGDRNKKKWDIKNAVANLNKELARLLPPV